MYWGDTRCGGKAAFYQPLPYLATQTFPNYQQSKQVTGMLERHLPSLGLAHQQISAYRVSV